MKRECLICLDENRLQIDRAVIGGGSLASIAKKFNVSYSALTRHAANHISRQLAKAWEKRDLAESHDLLNRIDGLLQKAEQIFDRNYRAKRDVTALKALAEQRSTYDLLARISFNLHQAKLSELELARQKSGDDLISLEEDYQQKLQILTTAELKMLQRLQTKVLHQTETVIIKDRPQSYIQTIE